MTEDSVQDRTPRRPQWRSPRFRLSVRSLMVLVLVVGVGIWGAGMVSTVQSRRVRVMAHAVAAAEYLDLAEKSARRRVIVKRLLVAAFRENLENYGYDTTRRFFYEWKIDNVDGAVSLERSQEEHRDELTAVCRERAAYHERMRRKWLRAACLPWTGAEPDPPIPPVDGRVTDQSY